MPQVQKPVKKNFFALSTSFIIKEHLLQSDVEVVCHCRLNGRVVIKDLSDGIKILTTVLRIRAGPTAQRSIPKRARLREVIRVTGWTSSAGASVN